MRQRAVLEVICGFAILLSSGASGYAAEDRCRELKFRPHVDVASGALTLSDLLTAESCAPLRAMTGRISLGKAPRLGSPRVFGGEAVRALVDDLTRRKELPRSLLVEAPPRIVVRRQAPLKSCAQIASAIVSRPSDALPRGISVEDFDCAATGIPQTASVEVMKTAWEPLLGRWQFAMRCQNAEDCLPFLVWARRKRPSPDALGADDMGVAKVRRAGWVSGSLASNGSADVIKRGQTAWLRWEEAGMRMVLPVTCLEGGAAGDRVRVRFGNSAQTMHAEILPDATLRAAGRGADGQ